MIKIAKLALGAALAATLLAPGAAMAAGNGFTIANKNSTHSIQRVWYARTDLPGEPWKEVYLNYVINAQSNSRFDFNPGNVCMWDMKVQFSDGYTSTFKNVNVCRGDYVNAY